VAAANDPAPAVEEGDFITSPFVGTFYRSPRPDAPPFVEVGGRIATGQTVCIVEAMKLFNEIESDFDCEVLEVLLDNGQPVEFGAKLYRVRKL
jgi:acetyl-CoA carboxylase biotin carboxyl carrier protein